GVRGRVDVRARAALRPEARTVPAAQLGLPITPVAAAPTRDSAEPRAPGSPALADALGSVERAHLVEALRQTAGNVTRAAARLGISRDTLRYRMTKHGLGRDDAERLAPPRSRAPRPDQPEPRRDTVPAA